MKKFFARPVVLPPGHNQHLFLVKVLAAFLCLLGTIESYAYDFEDNGIFYNIISKSEKTVEVTYKQKYIGWENYLGNDPSYRCTYEQIVKIPKYVQYEGVSYSVKRIGDYAFANTVPNDDYDTALEFNYVTNEHLYGFQCIEMAEGIEEIEEKAFFGCKGLYRIVLPKTIRTIGDFAFTGVPHGCMIIMPYEMPQSYNLNSGLFNRSFLFIVPQKKNYSEDKCWASVSSSIYEIVTILSSEFDYNGHRHDIKKESMFDSAHDFGGMTLEIKLSSDSTQAFKAGIYTDTIYYEFREKWWTDWFKGSFTYNYTINKAPLHLGIKDADRVYGDENPEFTYSSISGFIDGEGIANLDSKPQLSTTATVKSDVGEYPISAIVEAQNYEFDGKCGTLTVTPAPLDVTVCNAERMYGESNPEFEVSYKGLKGKDILNPPTGNFQFNTSADLKSNVGNYPVEVVGGNLHNYTPTYHSGNLKITGAKLLLSGIDAEKIYGNENPSFQYAAYGFKFPEDKLSTEPSFSCNADIYSTPGQYPISLSGAEAQNYNIEYKHGILSVQKRELTASIGHYKMHYGEDVPDFFVNYNGFVNRENYTDIDVPASIEIWCDNPEKPDAGAWYVVPHSAEDDHYTFKYEYGTLEVYKANQSIEWGEMHEDCLVGDQFELTAVASTGLPVSYKVNDGRIASIYSIGNTYYLDCIAPGEVVITATQAGNNNYAPVSDEKRLTISEESSIGEITISESDLDSPIYNMQGIQVKNLIKGQIYIKNGKKFIAK